MKSYVYFSHVSVVIFVTVHLSPSFSRRHGRAEHILCFVLPMHSTDSIENDPVVGVEVNIDRCGLCIALRATPHAYRSIAPSILTRKVKLTRLHPTPLPFLLLIISCCHDHLDSPLMTTRLRAGNSTSIT